MNHKDWERHQGLIHRHDNAKFMKGTKRALHESPVIQAFPPRDGFFYGDAVVIVVAILALAVLGIGAGLG